MRFDLPAGWAAVTPWRPDGDAWRPGAAGGPPIEDLLWSPLAFGRSFFSHVIILRSSAPTCSTVLSAPACRMARKRSRPASFSAIHSRANSPAWIRASNCRIDSLVSSLMICGCCLRRILGARQKP